VRIPLCIVVPTHPRLPEQHRCEAVKLWKAGFAVAVADPGDTARIGSEAGLNCKGLCACCSLSPQPVGLVNRSDPYELLT
jgi:hypothetical protein